MPKKVVTGVVKSDKTDKTRRVEIPRLVRHPLYGKFIHKQTVCYVHDQENASSEGDLVEIIESSRRSKTKRWDLLRIIEKSTEVDVVALRAAQRQRELEKEQGLDDGDVTASIEGAVTEGAVTEEAVTEEAVAEEAVAEEAVAEEAETDTEEKDE